MNRAIRIDEPVFQPALLELEGVSVRFGPISVLSDTHFRLLPGEIHGLCGENGAGKSTLAAVMTGARPCGTFEGTLRFKQSAQAFRQPADALRAGIAGVDQRATLIMNLSIAENLLLGHEPLRFGLLDHARVELVARRRLARFGLGDIDPALPLGRVPAGTQRAVAIIRALSRDARVLILDEPCAGLERQEILAIFGWLKRLRVLGATIVLISNRIDELFSTCDRITLLRRGRTIATVDATRSHVAEVEHWMTSGDLAEGGAETKQQPPRKLAAI